MTKKQKTKHNQIKLRDYVYAYSKNNPFVNDNEPWIIGYVCRIIQDERGKSYIIGDENGKWINFREYKNAVKITAYFARKFLEAKLNSVTTTIILKDENKGSHKLYGLSELLPADDLTLESQDSKMSTSDITDE